MHINIYFFIFSFLHNYFKKSVIFSCFDLSFNSIFCIVSFNELKFWFKTILFSNEKLTIFSSDLYGSSTVKWSLSSSVISSSSFSSSSSFGLDIVLTMSSLLNIPIVATSVSISTKFSKFG